MVEIYESNSGQTSVATSNAGARLKFHTLFTYAGRELEGEAIDQRLR